jgi:hypothetical protein
MRSSENSSSSTRLGDFPFFSKDHLCSTRLDDERSELFFGLWVLEEQELL